MVDGARHCLLLVPGALLQLDILLFGKEIMGLDERPLGFLGAFLAIGIGLGSVLAGRLSGNKVELGLVPLGSLGMGGCALGLSGAAFSYPYGAVALTLLGLSGGLFIVPLIKGLPVAGGWSAMAFVRSFPINGFWGIGVGLLLRDDTRTTDL